MAEFLDELISSPVNMIALATTLLVVVAGLGYLVLRPKFFRLMLKNLGRNPVRTSLIGLASTVHVRSVTLVWTNIYDLDLALRERSKDFKLIVTERWQLPSQIPIKHADYLDPRSPSFLPELSGKYGPKDFMTWSFYGGSVDPTKRTAQNILFFFAMDPDHIKTMMDDLDTYDDAIIAKLKAKRNGCLLGLDRLRKLNLQVGDTFKVYSFNYKDIDLDFEIVGALPAGRYDPNAIMRADYFLGAFDEYERKNRKPHFMQAPADRRLNLIWMRVPDRAAFNEIGELVEKSPVFAQRPVKVETASSGISSFLEAYFDLIKLFKNLVVPSILVIMALVVEIAISISIRERRTEIAVMKVLGFKPAQVMTLVIGESLLLGAVSGFVAALFMYLLINYGLGGIKFPVAFFSAFMIPVWGLFWGPAMGSLCALAGSFFPAQQARNVKVSEVFSKVA